MSREGREGSEGGEDRGNAEERRREILGKKKARRFGAGLAESGGVEQRSRPAGYSVMAARKKSLGPAVSWTGTSMSWSVPVAARVFHVVQFARSVECWRR